MDTEISTGVPIYHDLTGEYGDPAPVLGAITEAIEAGAPTLRLGESDLEQAGSESVFE